MTVIRWDDPEVESVRQMVQTGESHQTQRHLHHGHSNCLQESLEVCYSCRISDVTLGVQGSSEAEFPSMVPLLGWDGDSQEDGRQRDQDQADQLRPSRRGGRNGN